MKKFPLSDHTQQDREALVDDISNYIKDYIKLNSNIRNMKINQEISPDDIDYIQNLKIPEEERPHREVAEELIRHVYNKSMLIQHPRFYGFVPSAVSPYSIEASVLNDVYNLHGGGYASAPGACIIEEKLISWMGSLAGYDPRKVGGLFLSGGSMSNLTALCAARDEKLKDYPLSKGVAYLSDQSHSSLVKGLRIIGIRSNQIRIIPSDENFRMRADLLKKNIEEDLRDGLIPFVVVGTLGTTNTGSIDPLEELADICEEYNLWFHIDGAYGGSVLLSEKYRHMAKGIERSDSFSWDTHKWALQVYSSASLIVKDKKHLLNCFVEHPEYLQDVINSDHTDPWDLGPEMSRPHRAMKFWFTLQAMGTKKLADVVSFGIENAEYVAELLKNMKDWEIISSPSLACINFRFAPCKLDSSYYDQLNLAISKKVDQEQFAFLVTTFIKGKRTLRMCLLNGNTTSDDIEETISYLNIKASEAYLEIQKEIQKEQ